MPYRNPAASLADLAEGKVDLAFLPLPPTVGAAQSGRVRLLAVASGAVFRRGTWKTVAI